MYLPSVTKLQQANVFTPVCHSVHRGEGALSGRPPLDRDPPPPDRGPLDRDPPGQRHPWTETPLDRNPPLPGQRPLPPGQRPPPPDRYPHPQTETPPDRDSPWTETPDRDPRTVKSGRYASYWNAFLLQVLKVHLEPVCMMCGDGYKYGKCSSLNCSSTDACTLKAKARLVTLGQYILSSWFNHTNVLQFQEPFS